MNAIAILLCCAAVVPRAAAAQEWSQPVRGSWVRAGDRPQRGDVTLAADGAGCEIVVASDEHTAVAQAAAFLAGDIEKISGHRPPIVARPSGSRAVVRLATRPDGRWEAYAIRTADNEVSLVGSNFRGTAFAAYTLSERLGIDPLYIWTGYAPERHTTLVLKQTDYRAEPPTFKYRGFFHDDEDILPRPFDENGYPLQTGTVPRIWYERFFETALRLRMNMVAPYVRVQRSYDIQKTASDWGLVYTSHHYDALVSNPWGFSRFGLAAARSAGTEWDWFANREGLLNFWRGGVLENRDLDVYWPVGLRGTQDRSYAFPAGLSDEEKNKAYREALDAQVAMTKRLLPPGKTPLFHFTLYTEMLPQYLSGTLDVPPEVTIVWTDDNDGRMRALPRAKDQWKHGVYYHLAYFSTSTRLTKQISHLITPMRIEEEFRTIVSAGATEYMLVNVSELREYVMEARMLAEIGRDAPRAFAQPGAAARYVDWWSREYFGDAAAQNASRSYRAYYQQLPAWDQIAVGANAVADALAALEAKFSGTTAPPIAPDLGASLDRRARAYDAVQQTIAAASAKMPPDRRQFFYEHVAFPLVLDSRQTTAALTLLKALAAQDRAAARTSCLAAFAVLKTLELDIARAERPPFEQWYRKTWIRSDESPYNVHRSFERTQAFLLAHER
jgi:hypothetical protein